MTTAVDTNVLVDVLRGDPQFGPSSAAWLRDSLGHGRLIACEVVWAELAALFSGSHAAAQELNQAGTEFSALSRDAALQAGERWRRYRLGGGPRTRVMADFLIGAHALVQADRLLSRDRGYFSTHFPDVPLINPQA